MEMIKRKEIEIENNSFSYIHSKGHEEDKNIFFFMLLDLTLKLTFHFMKTKSTSSS